MIPTWAPTAPPLSQYSQVQQIQQQAQQASAQQAPIVLRGKMNTESTSQPTESRIPQPDNDGTDASASNGVSRSTSVGEPVSTFSIANSSIAASPGKAAVFTSSLNLEKTLDCSGDFLRSKSLLSICSSQKLIEQSAKVD